MKRIMTLGCALALGVAWMIAPASAQEKAKDPVEKKADDKSMTDKVKDKAEAAKESIKDTAQKVKEKVSGATQKTERANVKTAQKSLKDKGLDPGPIDGVVGPKTRAALSEYQKTAGLPVTGELDTATSGKLMTDMSTSATPPSTPPAPSASPAPPAPKPAQK